MIVFILPMFYNNNNNNNNNNNHNNNNNNNRKNNNNNNNNTLSNENHSRHVNNTRNTVLILADSIVKNINGYLLTNKLQNKKLVKVRLFSGAKVSCMYDMSNQQFENLIRTT